MDWLGMVCPHRLAGRRDEPGCSLDCELRREDSSTSGRMGFAQYVEPTYLDRPPALTDSWPASWIFCLVRRPCSNARKPVSMTLSPWLKQMEYVLSLPVLGGFTALMR
jgi:hypothetical protein